MTCMCSVKDKLEAERFVVFRSAEVEKPEPLGPCARQHFAPNKCEANHITIRQQEKRDKFMFNAGRYAAGARDSIAVKANQQLERELDNA